jgi:hypothetical protein
VFKFSQHILITVCYQFYTNSQHLVSTKCFFDFIKKAYRNRSVYNSILYIEGEKCMIFPKVQFVARGRSPRATKHRGKNEHSLQKYIYYFFHGRE